MGTLSKRVQVLFSKDKFAKLENLAKKKDTSVGSLIREAVEEKYLKKHDKQRMAILAHLSKMSLPVSEWEEIEKEIIHGALGAKKRS